MEGIDTSGRALVEHWKRAADKGLMNANTANALRAACSQVLATEEDWQTLDVNAIDIDDLCRRFQNKRHADFKPESLESYKRRFGLAVKLFLEYAKNPGAWRGPAQDRAARREKKAPAQRSAAQPSTNEATERSAPAPALLSGLVEYPFPLREGRPAYLRLPADLKAAEVKRLTAFLNTLTVDEASQPST